MDFVTVRDLRLRSTEVWRRLREKRDVIVMSHGQPIALLIDLKDEDVEETLAALRRARAHMAVSRMRMSAAERGASRMTLDEIDAEIREARQGRHE